MSPFRRRGSARGNVVSVVDPASVDGSVSSLLTAAGQGDQEAFARLYDELSDLVYGTVLRVVRDRALSEEVTQEVFVEVWRLAPRYDRERGSVRSWVATIAHRRAVDRVRSEQAGRNRDQRDTDLRSRVTASVDEVVTDQLDRDRVKSALGQLTDLQREAVEFAYYGGHTYREVAVLLDVAEGTIKTRIRDGLIRLRDELGVE